MGGISSFFDLCCCCLDPKHRLKCRNLEFASFTRGFCFLVLQERHARVVCNARWHPGKFFFSRDRNKERCTYFFLGKRLDWLKHWCLVFVIGTADSWLRRTGKQAGWLCDVKAEEHGWHVQDTRAVRGPSVRLFFYAFSSLIEKLTRVIFMWNCRTTFTWCSRKQCP